MKLREVAQTGIKVSPLGLGTVKFGRNQGVKYPRKFTIPDDKEVKNLLACAYDLGINLLDTAPAYGMSESRLGRFLKGQRSSWVIETKVGETFIDGESVFDFSEQGTRISIENSLRLLGTDYLDIVLIHSDGQDESILKEEAVLEVLFKMKREGWIRAVGISSKTVEGGLLALDMGCDVIMATYNPLLPDELPVLQSAQQKKRAVFIKKAFASGHLEKLGEDNPIENTLRFIFEQKGVTSVISGTINQSHLIDNAAITEKILSSMA